MSIRGILFDKDGTLVDFYSLWVKTAHNVVSQFIKINKINKSDDMENYILGTIGVHGMEIDPKGALAYKSYSEIAQDIQMALKEKEIDLDTVRIKEQIVTLFDETVAGDQVEFKQLGDVKRIICALKEKSYYIGLATADSYYSARKCLDKLTVTEKFDFIGADDGIQKPKPDPDMFHTFQYKFGLKAEEIAVVGDSYNDIVFAKQSGGIAIGVLSGVSNEEDFCGGQDYLIGSINELESLLEHM